MHYLIGILLENSFTVFTFWIFAFLGILGLSLELRARFNYEPSTSLLISSLGILNILYWGAFFSFFLFQFVILAMGTISLIRRRQILESDKVLYLIQLVLVLWFAGICNNNMPFGWDEFFWTLFDKHINQFSTYWTSQSAILLSHVRYMPGPALWHNFFALKGVYSEATSYFANSILFLVIIYWLVDQSLKANRYFLFFIIYLALGSFSEGWFTLYVDPFLGMMMAISLITGIKYFHGEKKYLILLILSLSGGVLLKETGATPVLALLATLLSVLLLRIKVKFNWKYLIAGLVYCFALMISWKIYQKSVGGDNPLQVATFNNFSEQIIKHHLGILAAFSKYLVTYYGMIAIWGLCILVARFFYKRSFEKVSFLFFFFVVIGFMGVHLLAWLFFASPGDGLALSGNPRYTGTLLMAIFVFYSVQLSEKAPFKLNQKIVLIVFLCWAPINLLFIGIKPSALFMLVTPHPKQVPISRKKFVELSEKIPLRIAALCKNEPQKIWFIYQDSIGFEAMMARHILAPCPVAHYAWSLGEPYYPSDVFTANFTDENFLEMASHFPLMVIANIDDKFINKYGRHFTSTPQVKMLYRFDPSLKKYVIRN